MLRTLIHSLIAVALLLVFDLKAGLAVNAPSGFKTVSNLHEGFRENKGQVHDQFYKARPDVLFSGQDGRLNFYLKANGISYQLNRVDSWRQPHELPPGLETKRTNQPEPDQMTFYRLDVNWLNANPAAQVIKGSALKGYDNFYLESCPEGALVAKSYEQIVYRGLYPGIDLKWYRKNGRLKYDYLVSAGADYQAIELELKGVTQLRIGSNGELIINTPLGEIVEEAPYTEQNGHSLKTNWVIKGDHVSFHIFGLDKNLPFTIDPLVRLWGTYMGGSDDDYGCGVACDGAGNVYLAGETRSTANMVTAGAHQTVFGGSQPGFWGDAFLAKFDASGNRLWSTYYGGSLSDWSIFCFLDPNGDVYMTGGTNSTVSAVIATPGAHQTIFGGGNGNGGYNVGDAFLIKFSPGGLRIWGTYYGGNGSEWASEGGCADAFGNVYLSGCSTSTTAISTPGSHQDTPGGNWDAFLVQFNSAGVRQWATYYGGVGTDYAYAVSADGSGNVYFVGQTTSNAANTAIATPGSHQTTYGGGLGGDAFLVKFNSSGVRQWGTFYGGAAAERGYGCKTSGNFVYISGNTESSSGISSPGSHQPANAGVSMQDGFLAKFDGAGNRQWGTYYGGIGVENWAYVTTDLKGDVYLCGGTTTNAGTALATPCTYQDTYGGGAWDTYLAKFNPAGTRLWGTYYGGSGSEEWAYCTTDVQGNIFLSGPSNTPSGTAVASVNSHQPALSGLLDAFIVKFDSCKAAQPPNSTPPPNMQVCAGFQTLLTTTVNCGISWYSASNGGTPLISSSGYITPPLFSDTTFYIEQISCGDTSARTAVNVTVLPVPVITAAVNPSVLCAGQSATFTAGGGLTYTWSSPGDPDVGNATPLTITPASGGQYTVTGSDGNCPGQATVQINVIPQPVPIISTASQTVCRGSSFQLVASGADNYNWQPATLLSPASGSLVAAQPQTSTVFTLTGYNSSGPLTCSGQNTLAITVISSAQALVSGNVTICEGQSTFLSASGGGTYTWQPEAEVIKATESSVMVSPTVTTQYTVTVGNGNGCVSARSVIVAVNPKPKLSAGRDTSFNLKEPMVITATGTGKITWIAGDDISCRDCPSTQVYPFRKTCYTAQAINEFGCIETDEICVDVGTEHAVYVPNSFSPNHDGLNESFFATGFGVSNLNMQIYDRWGELLFDSGERPEGWNGTYKGQNCKMGTYIWVIHYNASSGKREELTGHVNLIR